MILNERECWIPMHRFVKFVPLLAVFHLELLLDLKGANMLQWQQTARCVDTAHAR